MKKKDKDKLYAGLDDDMGIIDKVKNDEDGFAFAVGLILLTIVLLLVGAVYFVYECIQEVFKKAHRHITDGVGKRNKRK